MGFFRPQLVVSGLFFHDGIQAITKPFSWTFPFFQGGTLAITKPFSWTFFHDVLTNFFIFSRCSHELFSFCTMFSRTFFFFHDGILAITKPFSRTFFFTMGFWLSRAFLTNFFSFFTMGFWLPQSLCHELFSFFHDGTLEIRDLGEDSFYTYITKSIYRLVKNLASWFRAPFARKRVRSFLFYYN
jgi:hypothetical protein